MRTFVPFLIAAACGTPAAAPPTCDALDVLKELRINSTAAKWSAARDGGDTDIPDDSLDGGSVTAVRDLGISYPSGTVDILQRPGVKLRSCTGQVAADGDALRPMAWTITTWGTPASLPWQRPAPTLGPIVLLCDATHNKVPLACPERVVPDELWKAVWPDLERTRTAGGGR